MPSIAALFCYYLRWRGPLGHSHHAAVLGHAAQNRTNPSGYFTMAGGLSSFPNRFFVMFASEERAGRGRRRFQFLFARRAAGFRDPLAGHLDVPRAGFDADPSAAISFGGDGC